MFDQNFSIRNLYKILDKSFYFRFYCMRSKLFYRLVPYCFPIMCQGGRTMKRFTILAVGLAGLGLAGCAQGPSSGLSDAGATISASSASGNLAPASSDHMQGVESRKHHAGQAPYHASDNCSPMRSKNFREGRFGLAEKSYRKAVELSPRDAEAWVGLAASYDRLRRFRPGGPGL
jgi:hypothetical protein